jgi:hypothetical protein
VILALRRLRQEDCKFEDSLGYIVTPFLKNPDYHHHQKTTLQTNKQTRPPKEKS